MTTATVSDATRNDTWEMLLYLEHQVRCYGKPADRHSLRYRCIRYFLLFGIILEGAAVYFLATQPVLLWAVAGPGAAALGFATLLDASTNYAQTAATLRTTAMVCDDLKVEAEELWRDIEACRVQDEAAQERYNSILERWSRATQRVAPRPPGLQPGRPKRGPRPSPYPESIHQPRGA